MSNLVIAEHDNQALGAATLNAITAATKIGGDIHVLVAGSGAGDVARWRCQSAACRCGSLQRFCSSGSRQLSG